MQGLAQHIWVGLQRGERAHHNEPAQGIATVEHALVIYNVSTVARTSVQAYAWSTYSNVSSIGGEQPAAHAVAVQNGQPARHWCGQSPKHN